MQEPTWSWSRALEEGTLSQIQLESLQAMVDDGQADSLAEAAMMMDDDVISRVDQE